LGQTMVSIFLDQTADAAALPAQAASHSESCLLPYQTFIAKESALQ